MTAWEVVVAEGVAKVAADALGFFVGLAGILSLMWVVP